MPLPTANGLLLIVALAGAPLSPSQARDCSAGRFQEHAPYTHDESLPFDFAQPAGWVAESEVSGPGWVTIHKPHSDVPRNAVTMSIDVVVCRTEAVKLRELVIHSLSPNGDTTFRGR